VDNPVLDVNCITCLVVMSQDESGFPEWARNQGHAGPGSLRSPDGVTHARWDSSVMPLCDRWSLITGGKTWGKLTK